MYAIKINAVVILCCIGITVDVAQAVGLSIDGPTHAFVGQKVDMDCIVPTELLSEGATSVEWRYRRFGETGPYGLIYQYRLYPAPPTRSFVAQYLNQSATPNTKISMPEVAVERSGEYQCVVETIEGDALQVEHVLDIIKLPVTNMSTSFDDGDVLSVGDEVRVNCTVSESHPKPDVYWVLNDNRVQIEDTEDGGAAAEEEDDAEEVGKVSPYQFVSSTFKVNEDHLGKRLSCHAKVTSSQGQIYTAKSDSFYLNSALKQGLDDDLDGKYNTAHPAMSVFTLVTLCLLTLTALLSSSSLLPHLLTTHS